MTDSDLVESMIEIKSAGTNGSPYCTVLNARKSRVLLKYINRLQDAVLTEDQLLGKVFDSVRDTAAEIRELKTELELK